MLRIFTVVLGLVLLLFANNANASNYGYSVNVNFAANGDFISGPAGRFNELTWNNFNETSSQGTRRLVLDIFGDQGQVIPQINWQARSQQILTDVKPTNINDGRLIRGFLDTPTIILEGLDRVVEGPVNYALILYTHGGREGAVGKYSVQGASQSRIDNQVFAEKFQVGPRGNMVVFEDLNFADLVIQTEGFAPINAMSVMYCRPGDVNGDGVVDVSDLDEINEAFKDGTSKPRYDINLDTNVDFNDVMAWIKWSKGTCIGDVNLDGVFDSDDLIQLFQKGTYESGGLATWTSGDWNGDCKFDSSDLLLAFQEGCYEGGVVKAEDMESNAVKAESVPEPATATLLLTSLLALAAVRRRA